MAIQACSGCGTAVADENVLYTAEARIVCAKCYAAADIVETDKRHAHAIRNAAIGSSLAGIGTFFSPLSGFTIVVVAFAIAAIGSGIYAIQSMSFGQERFTKHLTPGDRILVWVCSLIGIIIASLVGLTILAGFAILFSA